MPQFINPRTQTFIVLHLVIYSTYKKVGDTADLSGSLDLALYYVLKLILLQTTKQLHPVSWVLSANPQRELLNITARETMFPLYLFWDNLLFWRNFPL